jgi:glycosyltransferase involved in cell wall biosynthesis
MTVRDATCRLSVLLVTFNQERYVHQALTSLFGQAFDGPIELVVADDGSSDHTLDIISGFERIDARFRFEYLDSSSNIGITKNYQRGFAACTGDYVAILEGDDYWVSPAKLQRQADFLDAHWECDLCSVNYLVYEEERAQFTPRATIGPGHRLIGARDQIADNLASNFSTCMYRRTALASLPEGLFETTSYDWIVNICVARRSLIGFLEEPMSVYRLHAGGVWTRTPYVEQLKAQLELIPTYDALTEHVFQAEFDALADRLRSLIAASLATATEPAECPQARAQTSLVDSLPPLVVAVGRAITPPAARRFLMRLLDRSRR